MLGALRAGTVTQATVLPLSIKASEEQKVKPILAANLAVLIAKDIQLKRYLGKYAGLTNFDIGALRAKSLSLKKAITDIRKE